MKQEVIFSSNDTRDSNNDMLVPQPYYVGLVMVLYLKITVIYHYMEEVEVLAAQSCLTLHNPLDYSPPGSSVHGILQAGILEWIAIPFSRGSS